MALLTTVIDMLFPIQCFMDVEAEIFCVSVSFFKYMPMDGVGLSDRLSFLRKMITQPYISILQLLIHKFLKLLSNFKLVLAHTYWRKCQTSNNLTYIPYIYIPHRPLPYYICLFPDCDIFYIAIEIYNYPVMQYFIFQTLYEQMKDPEMKKCQTLRKYSTVRLTAQDNIPIYSVCRVMQKVNTSCIDKYHVYTINGHFANLIKCAC